MMLPLAKHIREEDLSGRVPDSNDFRIRQIKRVARIFHDKVGAFHVYLQEQGINIFPIYFRHWMSQDLTASGQS
jgi:LPS sulfotransferase NodH